MNMVNLLGSLCSRLTLPRSSCSATSTLSGPTLSFIGLEQKKEYGAATIAKIRSDLYHCIMQTRGEVSQQLEIQIQATGSTEKTLHRWLPIAASLVLSFTI